LVGWLVFCFAVRVYSANAIGVLFPIEDDRPTALVWSRLQCHRSSKLNDTTYIHSFVRPQRCTINTHARYNQRVRPLLCYTAYTVIHSSLTSFHSMNADRKDGRSCIEFSQNEYVREHFRTAMELMNKIP
jgi:hypothetical protein